MFKRLFSMVLPVVVAVVVGGFTLLGGLLSISYLVQLKTIFVQWAMVVGTFAVLIAFLQLVRVNVERTAAMKAGWFSSALVLTAAILTCGLVLWQGPEGEWTQMLVRDFWVPGESALLALTGVTLIISGMRMLRTRRDAFTLVFLGVALILLIGIYPPISFLSELSSWIQRVPAMAGMRGILLGVALGVLMTGLRILLGIDRPHSDE